MLKTIIISLFFFFNIFLNFLFPISALSSFVDEDIKINVGGSAYDSHAPKIASDESGYVYIVWKDDRPDTPGKNIYFNKSNKFGIFWLANDIPLGHTQKPDSIRIGCDNSGNIYIAWIRGSAGNQDAMIAVSNNYGETWQAHQLDVGGPHWQSNTILNIHFDNTENGNICVVWDGGGNNDEIYINCSGNYGQTWMSSYNQVNSDVPYPYDIHQDPKVAVDSSGRVYVIWLDNRGAPAGERYIYVNRSYDLGQTWPQDIGFHGVPNGIVSLNPQIDCDDNGNVYVAWQGRYDFTVFSGSPPSSSWTNLKNNKR